MAPGTRSITMPSPSRSFSNQMGCSARKSSMRRMAGARHGHLPRRGCLCTPQEAIMATNDECNAAHLLEHAPGRQLSSAQLAEQTGWSPEELSAAVGLLRGRQQVVLDDAALGSGNYHIPSDLVVDQWASNIESRSSLDFLLLHN